MTLISQHSRCFIRNICSNVINSFRIKSHSTKVGNNKKQYSDSSKKKTKHSKRYADTLNLPQTTFPLSMKNGMMAKRELDLQKTKTFQSLYAWQREQDWNKEFVLHDGPPYANGKTHVGHFVNKILKDVTNRYKVLKRHRVHYIPGWDCHGMPIEVKVTADQTRGCELSPLEIRIKARAFALKTLEEQKASFQRWGIMADWSNIYNTLNPMYQVEQLRVFFKIYEKGFTYRAYMPVYWSTSSKTALAEAELEYDLEHISKSVFLALPLTSLPDNFSNLIKPEMDMCVHAVIWTTTPWTLPFNRAICYNPKLRYAVVKEASSSRLYLCEEDFVEKLKSVLSKDLQPVCIIDGSSLKGVEYKLPFFEKELPFLPASHVVSGKGTGLVHTAPAHGHDDFRVATEHGLPVDCHVDEEGRYTSGVSQSLLGKTVGVDADEAVLSVLAPWVLKVEDLQHSYPYDWRTKQPVIIRASRQWMINTNSLRPIALESLSHVKISPAQSEAGMLSQLNSRPYWCISRQRCWGVPMPVFYHKLSGEHLITKETVEHICSLILQYGADIWWELPVSGLLPDDLLAKSGKGRSDDYVKSEDIFDIWFDSGISWAHVLKEVDNQADVYLEGIDQYKGWFQTSLLTSAAVNGRAPYKQIVTHGFATDEKGKKMSKSIGNVIDPKVVIDGGKDKVASPSYGVDVLRWWVAHSHRHQQIMLGPTVLERCQEDVFKVRKCLRHLLGNLHDFDPHSDIVPYPELTAVDKYLLHTLYNLSHQIEEAYENFHYSKVVQNVEKYVYSDLSSFYINVTRDRCYCDIPDSKSRRSSQTAMYHTARVLTSVLSPIIPHFAEEIFHHLPNGLAHGSDTDSVFKLGWCPADPQWNKPCAIHCLTPVFAMRQDLMEELGAENPVEFDVYIYSSPQLHDLLRDLQPEVISSTSPLNEVLQTSQVAVLDRAPYILPDDAALLSGSTQIYLGSKEGVKEVDYKILIVSAQKHICERCRRYTANSMSAPCDRCLNAIARKWAS